MQVECRGNVFTMPRRCRFKPRIDCEAILGKLSSYSSLYHYITILLKPLFGFSSGEAIAVPVTALGAAGAAIGLVVDYNGIEDNVYSSIINTTAKEGAIAESVHNIMINNIVDREENVNGIR